MPTYRFADRSPEEQARIAVADDAERDRAARLHVAQEQAQAIGRMGATLRELRRETEAQAWEIARLRYYCEALERLLTAEQHAAAVEEAALALAQHDPPEWVTAR